MNHREFYADVPDDQREAFLQFRAAHPLKHISIGGTGWTYLDAGAGETTILWLVGGLKKADAAHKSIPILEDQFRIIAPDYPALSTMDGLADGVVAILDAENVEKACVLSGSFGGMLAQVLVRRHPKRVSKLILSTTTPPDKAVAARYGEQLQLVRATDEPTVREGAKMQFFGIIQPPEAEADFMRAYLDELFSNRLGKADIISTYEALLDYAKRDFSADDLRDWAGELLILDSDDDATFADDTRQKMYALYPNASTHTFAGAGHSPGSTQRETYFALVRAFFGPKAQHDV